MVTCFIKCRCLLYMNNLYRHSTSLFSILCVKSNVEWHIPENLTSCGSRRTCPRNRDHQWCPWAWLRSVGCCCQKSGTWIGPLSRRLASRSGGPGGGILILRGLAPLCPRNLPGGARPTGSEGSSPFWKTNEVLVYIVRYLVQVCQLV